MASALRAAVVGLGTPGIHHAGCIRSLPAEYELVGACDPSAAARQPFSTRIPGVATYQDFGELLRATRPDVAVIATNETPRCQLALQAVAAGVLGLYIEKPIAVSFGDARRLIQACEERAVPVVVNHQRRTLPVFRTLRRLIDQGAIVK